MIDLICSQWPIEGRTQMDHSSSCKRKAFLPRHQSFGRLPFRTTAEAPHLDGYVVSVSSSGYSRSLDRLRFSSSSTSPRVILATTEYGTWDVIIFSKHVAFGCLISGQAIVDSIEKLSVDPTTSCPLTDVVISHCGQVEATTSTSP